MSSSIAQASARFGRLWARGHESFSPSSRRILSVKGKGATNYLQGLLTSDLLKLPSSPREEILNVSDIATRTDGSGEKVEYDVPIELLNASITTEILRSACFLDHKGRNLTDALLWKSPRVDNEIDEYFIEVPANTADVLLSHLKKYKMRRSKIDINDNTSKMSSHTIYGTLNSMGTPPGYFAVRKSSIIFFVSRDCFQIMQLIGKSIFNYRCMIGFRSKTPIFGSSNFIWCR